MFDIAGTMWMVYLLYVYGLKSVWMPWLWPVFNQIFLVWGLLRTSIRQGESLVPPHTRGSVSFSL